MPARIELPDHWADARAIVTALAEGGHRWTEYRVNGKPLLELDCPCKTSTELPQVCPARLRGSAGHGLGS